MTIPFFNGIDYPIPSTIWSRVKFLNAREIISTIYLFRKETVSFINFINDPRAKVLEKNSVRRWITTGLESRRTFKICSARRRETAGKSAETLRENINSRRMAKGEGERKEERERERKKRLLSEVHESSFTQLFPVLWCIMLSRRTDLKSSASTALHEGTASRTRHSGALSTDLSDILCVPEV